MKWFWKVGFNPLTGISSILTQVAVATRQEESEVSIP